MSGHYISVEKRPHLDSVRVLDDHRVRVEVYANNEESYNRHEASLSAFLHEPLKASNHMEWPFNLFPNFFGNVLSLKAVVYMLQLSRIT